mgnify:CR=1 FL=1
MKKYLLLLLLPLLLTGCGKNHETFQFTGTIHGVLDCSMPSASIFDLEFGYIVSVITPDSIGKDFAYYIGGNFSYNRCLCYIIKTYSADSSTINIINKS